MKMIIRLSKERAIRMKAHLEKEHPMTRGKIKLRR